MKDGNFGLGPDAGGDAVSIVTPASAIFDAIERGERQTRTQMGPTGRWAIVAGAVWVVAVAAFCAGYFGLSDSASLGAPQIVMALAAMFGPLGFLWFGVSMARRGEALRLQTEDLTDEVRRLKSMAAGPKRSEQGSAAGAAALKSLSETAQRALAQERAAVQDAMADVMRRLDEITAQQSSRAAPAEPEPVHQDGDDIDGPLEPAPDELALVGEELAEEITEASGDAANAEEAVAAEAVIEDAAQVAQRASQAEAVTTDQLNWWNVACALDFPKSEDDHETLRALYAVLPDPEISALLQAAEDILAILAEENLYMDAFTPPAPPPEQWRAYCNGARGNEAAELGVLGDDAARERVAERMLKDGVLRDAAVHFIRRYDRVLRRCLEDGGNLDVAQAIGDSRTGRAFRLIGAARGCFG